MPGNYFFRRPWKTWWRGRPDTPFNLPPPAPPDQVADTVATGRRPSVLSGEKKWVFRRPWWNWGGTRRGFVRRNTADVVGSTGELEAAAASIDGVVLVEVVANGELQAQAAHVDGEAELPPPVEVDGALHAQASAIAGVVNADVDVTGDLEAQPADFTNDIRVIVDANGVLEAGDADISADLEPIVVDDGVLQAGDSDIGGYVRQNMFATVAGSSVGTGEFVGTTTFTMMIEDEDARLSYSGELRLRSLS